MKDAYGNRIQRDSETQAHDYNEKYYEVMCCVITTWLVQSFPGNQVTRRMSKYTSAENPRKTAGYVYKFNKKIKFVYIDQAFQPEIMARSQREEVISNRWSFCSE